MNILIINHYAGSCTHGMEYRPYYIAKELVGRGNAVSIIASSYSHLRGEVIGTKYEKIDGINYYWETNITYQGNGIKRILNMILFSFQIFLKARHYAKNLQPDVVIASSPHPFIIFGAKRIASISKAKLFFEVRDLWPMTLIKLGGISKYNPFIFFMQIAEDFAYKHSDKVISLLPNSESYMIGRGLGKNKFVYIPNGVDLSEWRDVEALDSTVERSIIKQKDNGKFIIGYVGGHSLSNVLHAVIEAMALIKEDDSLLLVLVGEGAEKAALKQKVINLNINNVIFLNQIKKRQIPSLLNLFDALYIGSDRNPLYEFGVSPNKLMDYMMSAKPIVQAMDASNNAVEESKCGISIEPENVQAISEAILQVKNLSTENRSKMGQNGKKYVIENHLYSKLVDKLLREINNVRRSK